MSQFLEMPKNDGSDNYTRLLVKTMIKQRKTTLTKVVKTLNELHPDRPTTTQNISNKLARDSLKLVEFVEIAEACGYAFRLEPIGGKEVKQTTATAPVSRSPLQDKFKAYSAYGYATVESPNYGHIVIAGKQAEQAAEYLREHIDSEMTDADELVLCNIVNNRFSVAAKPASGKNNAKYTIV